MHPFGGHLSRHWRTSNPADPYLSYYDVRISQGDVDTLKNDWLTDNIIAFWEEYLVREYLVDFKNSKIVLLQPSVVQLLKQSRDPAIIKTALPDFSNTTHVFLPVNDCSDMQPSSEGGSHWSLLLVSIVDGVAFHYDSMHLNAEEAYKTTMQLQGIMNIKIRFIDLPDTPQQENGSDCGVYVCLFMKHLLLKRLLMVRTNQKVSMSLGNKKIDAKEGRKEIMRVIEERRREGERRRSTSKSPAPDRDKDPPRVASPMNSS